MNVIEREMLRAKKSDYLSLALSGSVGVLLLFWAAIHPIGFAANSLAVFNIYGALVLALSGVWILAIRGYRSAALSDREIVECQNAVAIRAKKSPHRNLLEGFLIALD